MRTALVASVAGVAGGLWPAAAQAHLVSTGVGPVYDGIAHLFVSFEDLLPLVALALLAGLNGPAAGRRVLFTLTPAWMLGGLAGAQFPAATLPTSPAALSLLVLGVLVAADARLRPGVVTALALLLGVAHGWHNGVATATAGLPPVGLVGTAIAVFVATALLAATVVAWATPPSRRWTRMVLRVGGSWIAASGLLLLGWTLSGRA